MHVERYFSKVWKLARKIKVLTESLVRSHLLLSLCST